MKYILIVALVVLSGCSLTQFFEEEIEKDFEKEMSHEFLHMSNDNEDPYEDEAYRLIMEQYYRYHFTEFMSHL